MVSKVRTDPFHVDTTERPCKISKVISWSKYLAPLITCAPLLLGQSLRLSDGGVERDFVIASDELHVSGAKLDWVVRIDDLGTAKSLRAPGTQLQTVLYPVGEPRSIGRRRILTRRVSAKLEPGTDIGALAAKVRAISAESMVFNKNLAVFQAAESSGLSLASRLRQHSEVLWAEVILGRHLTPKGQPNDPLLPRQWTLKNTGQSGGTPGADANVFPVWASGRHGEDVVIAIVDDGVETAHPDLTSRIVPQAGYDYRDQDSEAEPEGSDGAGTDGKPAADSHGTAVAGIAAASGDNGIGVAGVAYSARLVPIRLIGGNTGDDQEAKAMAHRLDLVQISNNSWGADDDGKTITAPGPLMDAAFDAALSQGRGGLGTIFVWSGGNGGNEQDNANNDGYANHPGTIAVGALNDLGNRADYSEPGACLVVSAPSGNDGARSPGSFTTDLVGERGYNRADVEADIPEVDYTSTFNGTSAAAPVVSGVVALMLQANAELGWRDVQEILIRSAAMTQPENPGWFTNAAKIRFNHEFGAGRVDAAAAVLLALGWQNLGARQSAAVVKSTKDLPVIPDEGVFEGSLSVADELRVEQVTLELVLAHPSRGELDIELISPLGTISHLFVPHSDTNPNIEHRFTSVFNWGESARGDWKLRIRDTVGGNSGQVSNYRLEVFGTRSDVQIPDLQLTALGGSPEGFRLRLKGPADRHVVLQASSDLMDWQVVASGTIDGGDMQIVDTSASETARFYRLVLANP